MFLTADTFLHLKFLIQISSSKLKVFMLCFFLLRTFSVYRSVRIFICLIVFVYLFVYFSVSLFGVASLLWTVILVVLKTRFCVIMQTFLRFFCLSVFRFFFIFVVWFPYSWSVCVSLYFLLFNNFVPMDSLTLFLLDEPF